ncbi:site-specific integrase [Iodobacter sp. LRB]|uniref:tyrosine-type recombinase/integrase n=1 Tax=Iodobacter sp. LRB TaxID=3127955 RepID=UPI00307F9547
MAAILKRGDYQWQATIRKKGYPTQCKTFETKRDAEDWSKTVESEMRRGLFIDRTEAERTSFADALARYAEQVTPGKKGRVRELNRIACLQKQAFSLRSLASLRAKDFAAYRDMRSKSVSANTVRLELALISHVFTVAKTEWNISIDNPISAIRKPKLPPGRDRRFKAGEEMRLMAAITCNSLRLAVQLSLGTGMREGELVGLTWDQIDFNDKIVQLSDTKNGSNRIVPMTEAVEALLKSVIAALPCPPDPNERLLRYPNAYVLCSAFISARKNAGLENFTFHDLRHEAASIFAPKMEVATLAKVFGWKTLQMAMRYYHPSPKDLVAAVRL